MKAPRLFNKQAELPCNYNCSKASAGTSATKHVRMAVKSSSCFVFVFFFSGRALIFIIQWNAINHIVEIFHNHFWTTRDKKKRGDNARSSRLTDTLTSKTIQFALLEFLIFHKSPKATCKDIKSSVLFLHSYFMTFSSASALLEVIARKALAPSWSDQEFCRSD